jgi:hypothetical protein
MLRALARLDFPLVITTNYDQLFERALRDAGKQPRVEVYKPEQEATTDFRNGAVAGDLQSCMATSAIANALIMDIWAKPAALREVHRSGYVVVVPQLYELVRGEELVS